MLSLVITGPQIKEKHTGVGHNVGALMVPKRRQPE